MCCPHKLGQFNFSMRSSFLNIKFYFNISPASYTLCWGDGIYIFLCILNRQSEFSEICEVGRNYCVSNKVPGYPFQIFDLVNGWGSYFLPSAIAACDAIAVTYTKPRRFFGGANSFISELFICDCCLYSNERMKEFKSVLFFHNP